MKTHFVQFLYTLVFALFSVVGAGHVNAAATVRTWDGGGADNNWATTANWDGTGLAATEQPTFAGSTRLINTNNTAANTSYAGLVFSAGAGAFVLRGNVISMNGNLDNNGTNATTQTVDLNLALAKAIQINANSNSTIQVNSVISGAFGLTINNTATTDTGTVILTGTNTYTGTTVFKNAQSGVLNIRNGSALGTTAAGTTILSGNALELQGGIAVGAEALSLIGTGISGGGGLRNVSGDNSWAGAITLAGAARINSDSGTLTLDVASGSAIIGTADNLTIGGAGNVTVNDPIATTTGTLTKDGGGTLTLNGANTYTGLTTISGGTLALGSSGSLASGDSVSIAAGATFDVSAKSSPYNWGATASLTASGTGTSVGSTAAAIQGPSSGTVDLGTRPITLTYDGSNPALYISQGTLSLSGNAFTVNGSVLPLGTYTIVQQASGNISSSGSHTVTGTAVAGLTGAISVSGGDVILTVTPGPLDHFSISAISSPQTAGTPLTIATITAQDVNNNTVTTFNGTVTFGGTAGVTGTSAAFTAGVLSSASVTPTVAGSSLTVTVDDGASHTGSATITTVNPGTATQLVVTTQPSARTAINTAFAQQPVVKIADAYGNAVTTGTDSTRVVTVALTSGSGTLAGTLTKTAVAGVADFTGNGLKIDTKGAGKVLTFTTTGGVIASTTSAPFAIGDARYAVASAAWNLTTTWAATSGGAAGASVPVDGDDVFIAEAATARTVSIPASYSAVCGSLTMGAAGVAAVLNFSAASSTLAVSGNLVMNRPTGGVTSTIGVGAGSLTVSGNLQLAKHATSGANNNRLDTITVSTGTITVGGDLIFDAEQVLQSQIVFSGAGTLNLAGAFTLSNNLGTLTPSTGTVNFNGVIAQTIPIGVSAVTYNNLNTTNTSSSGATLSAAITGTLVTGNLGVQGGTFDNGGFAITLASAKNFSVANGATFNLTGTSTMVTVSGGGTKTFGASSTVNYSGAGSAQTVSAETYGNLTASGGGTKTAAGGVVANGVLTVSSTTLDMSTFQLSGTFTTAGNTSGVLQVKNTSATPIPAGKTWNFKIVYLGAGAQTVVGGTYQGSNPSLQFQNNAAVTVTGDISIPSGTLRIIGTSALDLNGYNLTISGNQGGINRDSGATFTAGSGMVTYDRGGDQSISAGSGITYNNLVLTNSGFKTNPVGTVVSGTLTVAGTAVASLEAGANIGVGALTLGGLGRINGTWGGTGSGATNINTTYFDATSGILTVTTDTRTTPTVSTWPTASGITYGQVLTNSTLTGGAASVAGSFAFTAPNTIPNAGNYSASVTFTPSDLTSYKTVTNNVSVTVNQAATAVAVSSSSQTSGYKDSVFFTATLPVAAAGNVTFKTNGVALSANALTTGTATSAATILLPRGTNTVTAEYAGDSNYLGSTNNLVGGQVVTNHPPVAGTDLYTRPYTLSATNSGALKIRIANLITNDTDTVDGDTVTWAGINLTSTNGVNLSTNGTFVFYTNSVTLNANDSFFYTVSDGNGGVSTGMVVITVVGGQIGQTNATVSVTSSNATVTYFGQPGSQYIAQRSTNLSVGVGWVSISTNTAPTNVVFQVIDSYIDLGGTPPGSAYYRLRLP